ncbi:hypothetical protein [Streptomyces salyersiae]|uniref:Uncharacterized protein n=1 Tax=Streptomyces salyersiae TaxID=3075530 RepID=A0ABU2RQR8_9ACTN|nr:hypothetical protein [Streptomyces sp. DSM 41770]MDT0430877.1 hypothetical protein [Streptomyces sp. DSM 41770]
MSDTPPASPCAAHVCPSARRGLHAIEAGDTREEPFDVVGDDRGVEHTPVPRPANRAWLP